jgi:hypothetical protein
MATVRLDTNGEPQPAASVLDARRVALQFLFRARRMQTAHYRTARLYSSCRFCLGVLVILLGAGSATSSFTSLRSSEQSMLQFVGGVLALLAAASAGLQTFLNFAEHSASHQRTGAKFANLKHKLEVFLSRPLTDQDILHELPKFEKTWEKIRSSSPNVPFWNRIENSETYEDFLAGYCKAKMLRCDYTSSDTPTPPT